jgi:sugar phosphate isomerase/epimerase
MIRRFGARNFYFFVVLITTFNLLFCTGQPAELSNFFFSMDTGTENGFSENKVAMLKQLGFSGMDFSALAGFDRSLDQLPQVIEAADKHHVKLLGIYIELSIDETGCPAELKQAIELLRGRETVIWAALRIQKYEPGSATGDEMAVTKVQAIADEAAKAGVQVALYPHVNFYAERVDDNVRIANKVGRDNVGVTFNLCHWLKVENGHDLEGIVQRALPYLIRVTINGADTPDGTDMGWNRLIQPLDKGSYDVFGFVKKLRNMGYDGPIGLQGYGIQGDKKENLQRSLAAWQSFKKRYSEEH